MVLFQLPKNYLCLLTKRCTYYSRPVLRILKGEGSGVHNQPGGGGGGGRVRVYTISLDFWDYFCKNVIFKEIISKRGSNKGVRSNPRAPPEDGHV